MAKHPSFKAPFGDPVQIDTDGTVPLTRLDALCKSRRQGFSLRVRTARGNAERGGYVFHIKPQAGKFAILDYQKRILWRVDSVRKLLKFVNHASGRQFDEEMYAVCEEINRTMGEPGAND